MSTFYPLLNVELPSAVVGLECKLYYHSDAQSLFLARYQHHGQFSHHVNGLG